MVDVNGGLVAAWLVAALVLIALAALLVVWLRSARTSGAAPLAVDTIDQGTGAPTQLAVDSARAEQAAAALDPASFERAMETTALDEVRETGPTDEPGQPR